MPEPTEHLNVALLQANLYWEDTIANLAMRRPTRAAALALVRAVPGILGAGARLSGKLAVAP